MTRNHSPLVIVCLLVLAALPAAAQLPPGQLYLKFNEGTGTTTADDSFPGSGVLATLNGSSGWNTGSPQLGFAALSVGPNAGDIVSTNTTFGLSGSWTIECWFTDGNFSNFHTLFGDSSAGGFACNKIIGFAGTDLSLSGGGINSVTIPNFNAVGWTHLAYVHDAGANNIKSYLNGVLKTTVSQPSGLTITGTASSGLKIGSDSATGPVWTGFVDEFRIWNVARSQADIMANMMNEISSLPDDLGVASIDAPLPPASDCGSLAANETLTFTVVNAGANTIAAGTGFVGSVTVNGGSPLVESFTCPTALTNGQTQQFSFATTIDLSTPGNRQVALSITYPADLNVLNDALTTTFAASVGLVTSYPYVEDFDSLPAGTGTTPPAGWTQDLNDASGADSDWRFRDGATPTANTGPGADHTTGIVGQGHYAHVEDSQASFAQVNLLSPCFSLTGVTNPSLRFYLHSNNAAPTPTTNENFFSLDLILPSGSVVADLVGPIGHQGNSWQAYSVDLTAFVGVTVQFRFRGRSDGGGGLHDIAIDDVLISDVTQGIGQAPQAGLAVLDLNNAQSPLLGPVSSGDNGPYSTTATPGGPLLFTLEGVPGQPVILLFGLLNPVAATFPNIGQMDIGGIPDPVTGIPVGIQVLGNGFTPGDFIDLLFVIGASGQTPLSFVMPNLPPSTIGAFQTANAIGAGNPIKLSNAVELTIL